MTLSVACLDGFLNYEAKKVQNFIHKKVISALILTPSEVYRNRETYCKQQEVCLKLYAK